MGARAQLTLAGGLAGLGRRRQADDVVTGIAFAWTLRVGILLIALLAASSGGGQGITAVNALFGSIYSLSAGASRLTAAAALAVVAGVLVAFRPLLLSTLDAELAAVRGAPVRLLGAAFLALLALVTAESTQAGGALLVLGLLAAPAGAAHQRTASPLRGLALSALLATLAMWGGLAVSYGVGSLPPSSPIIGLAASEYAAATIWARWCSRR